MVAGQLLTCVMEKASLQSGQHAWAVFEVVAAGELGNFHHYWLHLMLLPFSMH